MNNINLVGLLFALIAYLELTKEHFDIKRIKGGVPKKEEESSEEESSEEESSEEDEGISNNTMIGGGIGLVLLVAIGAATYLWWINHPEEAPGQGVLDETANAINEVGNKAGEFSAAAIDNVTAMYEAPVVEAPVVEAPVVEAPVVEAPVVEAPVVEAPVVEAPVDIPPLEGGNIIGGTIKKLKSQLKSLKRK